MKKTSEGRLYAIAAYTTWGLLPIYWKLLKTLPAEQILTYRITLSALFLILLLALRKQLGDIKSLLKQRKSRWILFAASIFVTANWGTYIVTVNSGHVLEASLGYYINPLLSIVAGMLLFHEKISKTQWFALLLAAIGVALKIIQYGQVPVYALILAGTFTVYGIFKKLAHTGSVLGLAVETILVSPFALLFILISIGQGNSPFQTGDTTTMLILLLAGVITATPLLWFSKATKRIPLSEVGFFQFLAPTINLVLAIVLYKEPFERDEIVTFSFVIAAVLIYLISLLFVQSPKKNS